MSDSFSYDVFLSHSAKDKAIVRDLAERLKRDGLLVWFDEWEILPGHNIPAKLDEGLERSRVLVLCMSAHAFGSEWAQLEANTFRFRDPLNKERRFVPLRLDDAHVPGSWGQFLFIDWRVEERGREYNKLLEACRPTWEPCEEEVLSFGHTEPIHSVGSNPLPHIFLSATKKDLNGHLDAVMRVVRNERLGQFPYHADPPSDDRSPKETIPQVGLCDVYLCVFAHHYGVIPPGFRHSPTELEHERAIRIRRVQLLFLMDEGEPWPPALKDSGEDYERVLRFRRKLHSQQALKFQSGQDLVRLVRASLNPLRQLPTVMKGWR